MHAALDVQAPQQCSHLHKRLHDPASTGCDDLLHCRVPLQACCLPQVAGGTAPLSSGGPTARGGVATPASERAKRLATLLEEAVGSRSDGDCSDEEDGQCDDGDDDDRQGRWQRYGTQGAVLVQRSLRRCPALRCLRNRAATRYRVWLAGCRCVLPHCSCTAGGRLAVTGDGFEMRAVDAARGLMELHEQLALPLRLFSPGMDPPQCTGHHSPSRTRRYSEAWESKFGANCKEGSSPRPRPQLGCHAGSLLTSFHGAGHFLSLRARALLAALPDEAEGIALLRSGVGPDLELSLKLRHRKRRVLAAAVQAGMLQRE